jgi:hypothetical protein
LNIEQIFDRAIPEPNSGCWLWEGSILQGKGYGRAYAGNRKMEGAHRASYRAAFGTLPDGLFVCHKCDVTSCVNPDHLFLGTAYENKMDAVRKQRAPMGTKHGRARLTIEQVKEIRTRDQSDCEYSRRFGVARSAVRQARVGETWGVLK